MRGASNIDPCVGATVPCGAKLGNGGTEGQLDGGSATSALEPVTENAP
jgi:hypothetical protein